MTIMGLDECIGCDAYCCKYINISIQDRDYSYFEFLLYHGITLAYCAKSVYFYIEKDCEFLDGTTCTKYDERPNACADYMPGLGCKKEDFIFINTIEDLENNKQLLIDNNVIEAGTE